ncbi:MAG TPA: hypothetical protein VFT95_16975 [Micromonosporaceae bacterium]|nr:hypothetical protein [Micromonosporaceae bacterium]
MTAPLTPEQAAAQKAAELKAQQVNAKLKLADWYFARGDLSDAIRGYAAWAVPVLDSLIDRYLDSNDTVRADMIAATQEHEARLAPLHAELDIKWADVQTRYLHLETEDLRRAARDYAAVRDDRAAVTAVLDALHAAFWSIRNDRGALATAGAALHPTQREDRPNITALPNPWDARTAQRQARGHTMADVILHIGLDQRSPVTEQQVERVRRLAAG